MSLTEILGLLCLALFIWALIATGYIVQTRVEEIRVRDLIGDGLRDLQNELDQTPASE